jgi:hypothetical protein
MIERYSVVTRYVTCFCLIPLPLFPPQCVYHTGTELGIEGEIQTTQVQIR